MRDTPTSFFRLKRAKFQCSALKTAFYDINGDDWGAIKRQSGTQLVPDLIFNVHHNLPIKVFIGNH